MAWPTRIEPYIGRAGSTANSPTSQTDMQRNADRPRRSFFLQMACPGAESGAIEGMASAPAEGRLFRQLVAPSLYGHLVPFHHRARIDRRLNDIVLEGPLDRPVAEGVDILSLADELEQLDVEQSQ